MKQFMNQIKGVSGAAAIVAAMLMSGGSAAWAGSKPSAPKAAPAPHASAPAHTSAPASHPAAGGAAHPAGGAAASHSPTANGGASASHGPTANGSHATTGASANGHTTAGGVAAGHTTAASTAGGHAGGAGNVAGHSNAAAPHGTTASHSAISKPVPHGTTEHVAKNGSAIRTRSNGKVSDVHDAKRGMDVHHGLDGGRRVETHRPDGSRMVADRGRRGFVERGYHYHGHDFNRRAYYYHGHEYGRYYRGYGYNGVYLNVYAPGYYYGPAFYGWAYNPWAAPIAYAGWGWGGSPWFGFYGGYFTPWATYASPAFWLTDYIVAQNLEAAYAARQAAAADAAAAAGAAAQAVLSEEVKQQIADEVKAQIALENQEATQSAANQDVDAGSSGIARMMSDGHPHVFVVGSGLDLTDSNGQECAVSEGDALAMRTSPGSTATTADLVVLASKGGTECASGGTVSVGVSDLQEMQNHLRETIDTGLKELQEKQGKGGLPAAPPSAQAKPTESPYAAVAPPASPDDEKDLQAQAQQADSAESEVAKEASSDSGSAAVTPTAPSGADAAPAKAPVTVALGQTPDQVKAILGNPTKTADLGGKQIYYYDGMKVVFKSGKVSDVE